MQLSLGSKVSLKRDMLGEIAGSTGYVVELYEDFDGNGTGVSIIFENGGFDGFSVNEQYLFLNDLGVSDENKYVYYEFKNVLQVERDFRNGYWKF